MDVVLKLGEKVTVRFEDTDGEVVVDYGEEALRVTSDLADDQNRKGVLYEEVWRTGPVETKTEVLHHPTDCNCHTCNWARSNER